MCGINVAISTFVKDSCLLIKPQISDIKYVIK